MSLKQLRLSARERSQVQTHQRLLDQGLRLFATQGISRTKAIDIARAASVAVGTLYLHFQDKDGLLHEILITGLGKLRAPLRALVQERHPSYSHSLRRHVEVMVDFVNNRPDLSKVMFHPEVLHTPVGKDVVDFMTLTMENLLREGAACGNVRKDIDPVVAAQALAGMLLHVLWWWAQDPSHAPQHHVVDTLAAYHLATLLNN